MHMKNLIKQLLIWTLVVFSTATFAKADSLCQASFTYEVYELLGKPSVIQFNDQSEGNPTEFIWDFGDGSSSNQKDPIHYFPANGSFEVSLSISNEYTSDQISHTIIIDVPEITIAIQYVLDSNHSIPNTFRFRSEIEGYYDHILWDFGQGIVTNVVDTIHSYPEQDTDYQVSVTAKYFFNDTSIISKTSSIGLTTSEYFDMGGQIYFGDALMNNPESTGDEGIAYLYRMDNGNPVPIDTNYFVNLGYYWFTQKLKAHYIIRAELTENSSHAFNHAPTYVGNTTQWEDAEIINLTQNKYREDIGMVGIDIEMIGSAQLEGSIYDILDIQDLKNNPIVFLYDTEENLIHYNTVDESGDYSFQNLPKGHYMLSADLTGIRMRPQLIYIDGKGQSELKSSLIVSESVIFPNPGIDYSILQYWNNSDSKTVYLQWINTQGQIIKEESFYAQEGQNFYHLDLNEMPKGMLLVKVLDEKSEMIKLLHR